MPRKARNAGARPLPPPDQSTNYGGRLYVATMRCEDGSEKDAGLSIYLSRVNKHGVKLDYLRCATHGQRCPARGKAENGQLVSTSGIHNHHIGRNDLKVKAVMIAGQRKILTEPTKRVSEARREAQEALNLSAAADLDPHNAGKRFRYWKKAPSFAAFDRGPWAEAMIPENLRVTRRGHYWLLYDSSRDPDAEGLKRLVVFTSPTLHKLLFHTDDVVMMVDASYKICGRGIYQALHIHIRVGNEQSCYRFIYVATVLMCDKSAATYERAWTKLFLEEEPVTLERIKWLIGDNEVAQWIGAKSVLAHLDFGHGFVVCQWHRAKNMRDRALKCGLSHLYDDSAARVVLKAYEKMSYLPVPVGEVRRAFRILNSKMLGYFEDGLVDEEGNFDEFVRYIRETYVGDEDNAARFPPEHWNCVSPLLEGIPVASSAAENFHSRCNFQMHKRHGLRSAMLKTLQTAEFDDGEIVNRHDFHPTEKLNGRYQNPERHRYNTGLRLLVSDYLNAGEHSDAEIWRQLRALVKYTADIDSAEDEADANGEAVGFEEEPEDGMDDDSSSDPDDAMSNYEPSATGDEETSDDDG